MIHISIDKDSIIKIKKIWGQWFFRANKIPGFIAVLDSDTNFREMIFPEIAKYNEWKLEFKANPNVIRDMVWRKKVYEFFFADLSNNEQVEKKYKKNIKTKTKKYLLNCYKNYRLSSCNIKIVNEMNIKVCPYCNRNFLENYSVQNSKGSKKNYFKGELDHHYSKDEIGYSCAAEPPVRCGESHQSGL